MRKIRKVLPLQAEGSSEREIARSVGCARSSVQICLWRAKQAGGAWPLSPHQDEAKLEALLYPRRQPGVEVQPTPDLEWIERELRRKHVTRRQLWREYLDRHPGWMTCCDATNPTTTADFSARPEIGDLRTTPCRSPKLW